MSGSLEEFGVATNDRQDVEDIGKVKNTYYYRIRKVGNYYLAARVGDDCSVNVGLTMQSISALLLMAKQFLECLIRKWKT
jgi:hypothetical protein